MLVALSNQSQSFLLEKIESGGLLAVELQLQNFLRTPDSDSKQTGNRNDLLGSLSVEWKWFGEEDVHTDASNHAPSSMIALLDRMICEGEDKGAEKCSIVLNNVACVLPHVVYDFDCIAAHRSLLLAERCKVKVVSRAIASIQQECNTIMKCDMLLHQ